MILDSPQGKHQGIIREKLELRKPGFQFCRYIVSVKGNSSDFVAAQDSIWRDRKAFTKQMLRQFLRKTISREAWTGAPWIVDDKLARTYKLELEVPLEKRYDAQQAARKASLALKKQEQNSSFTSFMPQEHQPHQYQQPAPVPNSQQRFPPIKPAAKSHKTKSMQANGQNYTGHQLHPEAQTISQVWLQDAPSYHIGANFQNNHYNLSHPSLNNVQRGQFHGMHTGMLGQPHQPLLQTSLPLIPARDRVIEDLELPWKKGQQRPDLKFFSKDVPKSAKTSNKDSNILMKSVGPLLQIWDTLNVHTGPEGMFPLDSFTFDDFVEAMIITSPDVECELFDEIHCAVLKQLVDDDGEFHVFGFAESEDEESDESEDESETSASPVPDPASAPPARSTRSSLAKSEAAALKKRSPSPELPQNQAAEMLEEYGWLDRLKENDFQDGGWQVIMVGFLRKVMLNGPSTADKEKCEAILAHLAPVDAEPTRETARSQYDVMDVNMRIEALEMASISACRTPKFKRYLDGCAKAMTQTRNRKTELQRNRKTLYGSLPHRVMTFADKRCRIDKLAGLDNQKKNDFSEEGDAKAAAETNGTQHEDVNEAHEDEKEGDNIDVLEKPSGRKRKRADKIERREKKKKMTKEEEEKAKRAAKYQALLDEIEEAKEDIKETEEQIAEEDADLREGNCSRAICLGKDRYCNRYYWFERNGMPYGGLPDSSTAKYGYANSRVWVQGPDENDYRTMVDLKEPELSKDRQAFGVTPLERKTADEGSTRLVNANQWGYYDEPAEVDALVAYLNDNGVREKALKMQLKSLQGEIGRYMNKLKDRYTEPEDKKDGESEERHVRMSLRNKKTRSNDTKAYSCQLWTNNMAREVLGHLHSEPPRPRKVKPKPKPEPRAPLNRQKKPVTRQGGRYDF